MKNRVWPNLANEVSGASRPQQVGFVPGNILKRRIRVESPGKSMNFVAPRYQQGQAVPTDETGRTCYQDFFHGL